MTRIRKSFALSFGGPIVAAILALPGLSGCSDGTDITPAEQTEGRNLKLDALKKMGTPAPGSDSHRANKSRSGKSKKTAEPTATDLL